MPQVGSALPPPAASQSAPETLAATRKFFTLKPALKTAEFPPEAEAWQPVRAARLSTALTAILGQTDIGLDIDPALGDKPLNNTMLPARRSAALTALAAEGNFSWRYDAKKHKVFLKKAADYHLSLPPMGWRDLNSDITPPPPVLAFNKGYSPYLPVLNLLPAGSIRIGTVDRAKNRLTTPVNPAKLDPLKGKLQELRENKKALAMRTLLWRVDGGLPAATEIAAAYGGTVTKGSNDHTAAITGAAIPPSVLDALPNKTTLARGWFLGLSDLETKAAFAEHPLFEKCPSGRDKAPAGLMLSMTPKLTNQIIWQVQQPMPTGKTPCQNAATTATDKQTLTLPFTPNAGTLLLFAMPKTQRHYVLWLQPYWIKL